MKPTRYRVDVRVLAFVGDSELLAGGIGSVEMLAAEYDALDATQLTERFVLPTLAAKQKVDAKVRGDA